MVKVNKKINEPEKSQNYFRRSNFLEREFYCKNSKIYILLSTLGSISKGSIMKRKNCCSHNGIDMNIKRLVISTLAVIYTLCVLPSLEASNLFCNHEFVSSNGYIPDNWSCHNPAQSQLSVYKTENGVLQIFEKPGTNSWCSQQNKIDPSKRYYFEVEMKSDQLSCPFSIVYNFVKGNKVAPPKRLLYNFKGPLKEWTKFSAVITIEQPDVNALSVSFMMYDNASKKLKGNRAVYLRNPKLEVYTGQKLYPAPHPDLPQVLFSHNFTGFPPGTPYQLEKGEVGQIRFHTDRNVLPRMDLDVEVDVPPGVNVELYLWQYGTRCRNVPNISSESGKFLFKTKKRHSWEQWGNTLMFTAKENVPDDFTLKFRLKTPDGNQVREYSLPVKQFENVGQLKLPKNFCFASWSSLPIMVIELDRPDSVMARQLSNYWTRCGWKNEPYFEIVRTIPYKSVISKTAILPFPRALDMNGTKTRLYCDYAQATWSVDNYVKLLTANKRVHERLQNTEHITWDYEPYVEGPVTKSCFCSNCIRDFCKQNKLPENLTPRKILAKYEKKWVEFRCRQRAAVVKKVASAIKQINPNAKFGLIYATAPPNIPPDSKKDYEYYKKFGARLPLFDENVDYFESMNYTDSLNFFRSMEREKQELKSEKLRTIISSGWGHQKNPKRLALQIFGAFICGINFPSIGHGLYLSQGDQLAALRRMMDDVARTEKFWVHAKYTVDKINMTLGCQAEGNVYQLNRADKTGKKWSYLINNSEQDAAFIKLDTANFKECADLIGQTIIEPINGKISVKLEPLSYRLLEFSPNATIGRNWKHVSSANINQEENNIIARYNRLFTKISKNGMICQGSAYSYKVQTPAQTLIFKTKKNSGTVKWYVKGKLIAPVISKDVFMSSSPINLDKYPAKVENVEIKKNEVELRLSYKVSIAPYDGLLIRRVYIIERNYPIVRVKIKIVPENGYRPFRLRIVNAFSFMKSKITSNETDTEYIIGDIIDRSSWHVIMVREGAVFLDNKPFFVNYRHGPKQYPLTGNEFIIKAVKRNELVKVTAENIDELFLWRDHNVSTIELIWPDAYPDNDPHGIKTWKAEYVLEFSNSKVNP